MTASAVMVQRSPFDIVKDELSFNCLDFTMTAGWPSPLLAFEFLPQEKSIAVINNNINNVSDLVFIIISLGNMFLILLN